MTDPETTDFHPRAAINNTFAVSFPAYLVKAFAWGAAAFFFAGVFASQEAWLVPLTIIALSMPMVIGGVYHSTIRKIRLLEIFRYRGRVAGIISGRMFPALFWTVYGVVSCFFMLAGFQFFTMTDWILFFAVIPIFYIIYRLFYHFLAKEIKPYLVTSMALGGSVLFTPFFMLAIYALALKGVDIPFVHYETLGSAIAAHEEMISSPGGSVFVKDVSEWMAVYSGIKAYIAGHAGQSGIPLSSTAPLFLAGYIIFFNAANVLAFCLIPFKELDRIIRPLSPTPAATLSGTGSSRSLRYTGVIAVSLALLAALFFFLETRLSENTGTGLQAHNTAARQKVVQYAERIDDVYVRPGTIMTIEAYKMDWLRDMDGSVHELERSIDRAFDDMILRVDDFLDWYYSLFAEYARMAHMFSGSGEDYLAGMLNRHLKIDENRNHIEDQCNLLMERYERGRHQLQYITRHLVEKNRISENEGDIEVANTSNTSELLAHEDFIGFDFRMLTASAASGGGLLAGGLIGKKIVQNIAKKSVFKASARGLARFGGGRAAGASTGAAVGSVVPGGGTVIGAAIGGIAGGLLMDKTLLMAEARFNRKTFKGKIVDALETARAEAKSRLYGGQPQGYGP